MVELVREVHAEKPLLPKDDPQLGEGTPFGRDLVDIELDRTAGAVCASACHRAQVKAGTRPRREPAGSLHDISQPSEGVLRVRPAPLRRAVTTGRKAGVDEGRQVVLVGAKERGLGHGLGKRQLALGGKGKGRGGFHA